MGVLLRFHQYPVAISGDIKVMFHQVRLLAEDRSLFHFLHEMEEIEGKNQQRSMKSCHLVPYAARVVPQMPFNAMYKTTKWVRKMS